MITISLLSSVAWLGVNYIVGIAKFRNALRVHPEDSDLVGCPEGYAFTTFFFSLFLGFIS